MMVCSYWISGVARHHWGSTDRLMCCGPLDQTLEVQRCHEDAPLQVCLDGSNCKASGGARFDCLSMAKKPKVRHSQSRIKGPQARSDGADMMEERGEVLQRWGSPD